MLAGVLVATGSKGGKTKSEASSGAARPKASPSGASKPKDETKGSFFEERWNKRMDQ
jgi:hypothetical protein